VKFTQISRERYDEVRGEVKAGTVSIRQRPTTFNLRDFTADPEGYNERLLEVTHGD